MSNTALIVSVVSLLGWLLLNLRSLDAIVARYGRAAVLRMALAWVGIFAAVAWIASLYRA